MFGEDAPSNDPDPTSVVRRPTRRLAGETPWPPYTAPMATPLAPPPPYLSLRVMATAQAQAEAFAADTLVLSLVGPGALVPRLIAADRIVVRMPDPHAYGLPDRPAMQRAAHHIVQTLQNHAFNGRHLVVHCQDGLSRSRSVGETISEAWGVPVTYETRWQMRSLLVQNAMREAFAKNPRRPPPAAP
jgi:hypothetical protein